MAESETQIMNDALALISVPSIASPDEESEPARQARSVYPSVVRAQLERYAWTFAKQQIALPQNEEPPVYRWSRAFALPSDFLRLIEVADFWVFGSETGIDQNPTPMFDIQGTNILTNFTAPLEITYIRDLTEEPTLWSAVFAEAVTYALAARLAPPLTKDKEKMKLAHGLYKDAIAEARRSNAIQLPPRRRVDGSWIAVRATI